MIASEFLRRRYGGLIANVERTLNGLARPGSQGGGDDRTGLADRSAYCVEDGGPVLMRKGNKHVVVHPNSELVEPTPEEIAKW
jgi:hypothetical protein